MGHKFSSDNWTAAKKAIQANTKPTVFYDDLKTRDNSTLEPPDLYVAGFPCQPFSQAGLGKGFNDVENGSIFFYIMEYINVVKPKCILLENVAYILHHNYGVTFGTILDALNETGIHNVYYQVINSEDHGIPHHRKRMYMCGITKKLDNGKFEWPATIVRPRLEHFLDTRGQSITCTGMIEPAMSTAD